MKFKSFRASRGEGGEPEFRRGLRVENCTTNRLLSLMIEWNVKASALRAGGGGRTWIQTRIKSRELYNESSSFSNDLMTRKSSFRALRGRGGGIILIQTRIKSRKRYNESSSFSNDLWNLKSSALRAGRERGWTWIQTRIKSRELYNESSSFSNDLMKRKSFRASRGRGGDNFNSDED